MHNNIWRGSHTSALAGFHAGRLSWSNFELEDVVFGGEGREEKWRTQRKALGASRVEWSGASAVLTAPSLLLVPEDRLSPSRVLQA